MQHGESCGVVKVPLEYCGVVEEPLEYCGVVEVPLEYCGVVEQLLEYCGVVAVLSAPYLISSKIVLKPVNFGVKNPKRDNPVGWNP